MDTGPFSFLPDGTKVCFPRREPSETIPYMESDEGPSRSIEDIAKDLQKETSLQRLSELADELHRALKNDEERDHKNEGA
jgi:hypothetical protein